MIHFLADENLPAPATEAVRAHGFSVVSVQERSLGLSDLEVIAIGKGLKAVILTFDRDYGDILFKDRIPDPPAVIFFRSKGVTTLDAAKRIIQLVDETGFDPAGKIHRYL